MSRGKKEIQPHWRPNFVDPAELPDIKVIRTGFIINFVAVTFALVVTFWLIQREYQARALSQTIATMEQQIAVAKAVDSENLALSRDFRKVAEHIIEVGKFLEVPIEPHDFFVSLSKIKPDDLLFRSISLGEEVFKVGNKNQLGYRISISGDAKSLTVLDDFKNTLESGELLNLDGFSLDIREALQGRDAETGIFPYQLSIQLVPGDKKPEGKGGA